MNGSSKRKETSLTEKVWQTGWTYIRNVVDTAREPFLILDKALIVLTANESFYRAFDAAARETEGKFIFDLGNGQWAGKHLRTLLNDILPKETFFRDFEVDHEFPVVGHKIFMLNARRVYSDGDSLPALIILAMEDVTKQRAIEIRLADYARELEKKVDERTAQLAKRIEQLELIDHAMTGRELKMVELKEENEKLRKQLASRK
jgi:chemotaxis protein methyltransferase CheR